MLFEVEPTFALMIFVNTIERPESLHNRLESARWSDGPSPFPQMGDVIENAAGVSRNIRVLLGDVPWRLDKLGKCGGRLLFADEPD